MSIDSPRKYPAFLSYRHSDNRQKGRQWASWLHHVIETYEVPSELVGKNNQRGEKIPAHIFPIFRDEDELPANANLGNAISVALENAERVFFLIVFNYFPTTSGN